MGPQGVVAPRADLMGAWATTATHQMQGGAYHHVQ